MHRGGLPDLEALAQALDLVEAEPLPQVTGLMGYGATSPPPPRRNRTGAGDLGAMEAAVALLAEKLGDLSRGLALNTAGSPTCALHLDDPLRQRGLDRLGLRPGPSTSTCRACSICSPPLSIAQLVAEGDGPGAVPPPRGADRSATNTLDPNSRRGFFLYGGYGDARPVSPPGLRFSALYGGRAMLAGSARGSIWRRTTSSSCGRPRARVCSCSSATSRSTTGKRSAPGGRPSASTPETEPCLGRDRIARPGNPDRPRPQ